jgi:hypothetical protein
MAPFGCSKKEVNDMSDYHHAMKMDGSDCHKCDTGTLHKVGTSGAKCDNCDFRF